ARIRAILRRTSGVLAEDVTAPLTAAQVVVWPAQRRAELAGQPLELTGTEYNLLEVLVRNAGRPVAKERLSELALGRSLERFDRSIDVHVSSLRRKLGALPGGRSCIQTVYRQGYQFILE
ncbi:MAG: winged helix-turn-helix domain-containing protein, partial [Betaproteobacteria bacterium]